MEGSVTENMTFRKSYFESMLLKALCVMCPHIWYFPTRLLPASPRTAQLFQSFVSGLRTQLCASLEAAR